MEKKENRTKELLKEWIEVKAENKTKTLLENWVKVGSKEG